jgi:hypothetical protein
MTGDNEAQRHNQCVSSEKHDCEVSRAGFEAIYQRAVTMEDDMADDEAERRLDELRERVNLAVMRDRLKTSERRNALLRWICYVTAASVFVATLFIWNFADHPREAAILGLLYAAVAFCIALLAVRVVRRFWNP